MTMSDLRTRILAYLDAHTTLSLATYGPSGLWACAVLYVNDGLDLYFTSGAKTRHTLDMLATGTIAGTINDECRTWESMKGIQLDGAVEKVVDLDERGRVVRAYLARFPFAVGLWHGESDPDVIARDPRGHDIYRITPRHLLFTDNEYAPGRRDELALAG
jgi:uncharacterized protein YhbP (UPF0306 family)